MSVLAFTIKNKTFDPRLSVRVPVELDSWMNLLIFSQILIFALYTFSYYTEVLDFPYGGETIYDFVTRGLALSSATEDLSGLGWLSVFSYSFFHFRIGDLLVNTASLWFFGKILQCKIGEGKVLQLYLLSTSFSAGVFIASHLIFPIFSDPGGIMEGAFGGALGLMSATVAFYGSYRVHLFRKVSFSIKEIYLLAFVLSLTFTFKDNLAYILVYISSTYLGHYYALSYKRHALKEQNAKVQVQGD